VVSFPQVSPSKPCIHLSSLPYVLHTPAISFFSTWSPEKYWVMRTDYKAPHYVVFLHSPVISSLLGPNILLSTLFSNTFCLRYSLNMSDRVSHSYTATGKSTRQHCHLEMPGEFLLQRVCVYLLTNRITSSSLLCNACGLVSMSIEHSSNVERVCHCYRYCDE